MSNFESLKIGDRVRLVTQGGKVDGRLAGVERDEEERVSAVLIRTLQARDIGSLYFTVAEIVEFGWTFSVLVDPPLPLEEAVQQVTA